MSESLSKYSPNYSWSNIRHHPPKSLPCSDFVESLMILQASADGKWGQCGSHLSFKKCNLHVCGTGLESMNQLVGVSDRNAEVLYGLKFFFILDITLNSNYWGFL